VTPGTVVLCPPLPGEAPLVDRADLADALLLQEGLAGIAVVSPELPPGEADDDERTRNAHWVAHIAIGLATSGVAAPVLLVLTGSSGALAAALGFSQKASRRAVHGYVLVDAVVPPAESRGGDWPDAPVHYVASPGAEPLEANQARLRGWDLHEVADVSPESVARVVAAVSRGA
jgi:hypothetical protein